LISGHVIRAYECNLLIESDWSTFSQGYSVIAALRGAFPNNGQALYPPHPFRICNIGASSL
jgi:hypothetical protein